MSAPGYARILLWYPPEWRDRYGGELVGLMEDTYGGHRVPPAARLGLLRSAAGERLRYYLRRGGGGEPDRRVRAGALAVLLGWGLFVIAGSLFAKYAEHWQVAVAPDQRGEPAVAYGVVVGAAGVGAAAVVAGALVALPAVVRFLGSGGWVRVRRPVLWAAGAGSATLAYLAAMVAWAPHVGADPHGGVLLARALAAGTGVALGSAAVVAVWGAVAAVVRRVRFGPATLRAEGALAVVVAACMGVIALGTCGWWAAMAVHGRSFLTGSPYGDAAPVPGMLLAAGLVMLVGLATALVGVGQVLGSRRRGTPSAGPAAQAG